MKRNQHIFVSLLVMLATVPAWSAPTAKVDTPMADDEAPGMVTAWVRVAENGQSFTLDSPQVVRYGDGGLRWAPRKTLSGTNACTPQVFGTDPAPYISKFCEIQKTVPNVVQVPGQMPVVNRALMPASGAGFEGARVRELSAQEKSPGSPWLATPSDIGAFRVPCGSYARMSNDDPVVFPGKPGASHLHTFVGNTGVDANSNADSLLTSGRSTCAGGTLNRTAYWMPTMIDTRTGQPILPTATNFYYKQGYFGVRSEDIQPFPKGLRIIAGDSSATKPVNGLSRYACNTTNGGWQQSIPACPLGGDLVVTVTFPQCWDGKNLDSPDHHSHMSYGVPGKGCPADHPVALPEITQNVHYTPSTPEGTVNWRLSSDRYIGPAGYSLHADWYGAWDPATLQRFIDHCLHRKMDCHDNILGDGGALY